MEGDLPNHIMNLFLHFLHVAPHHTKQNRTEFLYSHLEPPGEHHEFPKCYGAFGVAEAVLPEKVFKSYIIGQCCKKSGIRTVASDDLCAMRERTVDRYPFRDGHELLSATEGTRIAQKILEPLECFVSRIIHGQQSLSDLGISEITWEDIRHNRRAVMWDLKHRAQNHIDKQCNWDVLVGCSRIHELGGMGSTGAC